MMFNCLFRIDPETGKLDVMGLPPGMCISEPVHIVSKQPGQDGWLMMVIDQDAGDGSFRSEVWIVDAGKRLGRTGRQSEGTGAATSPSSWLVGAGRELESAKSRAAV
jgi:hypothetical protein